ncbi:hypothetical protein DFJ58DRAFT_727031 [Suillus subalutaceus]|uniref:uncharacterized protein n=1 Tax=Suillus subalutaceus TaxID=48586 RepID=UPI001B86A4A3|nr:uncharacterized protein DFJ58DRAFT_727031 [Suillus subalutaceus]KAG1857014.1 hypothetical protein DFJ58DRAFT_727031 [Suillus subalutaceus]
MTSDNAGVVAVTNKGRSHSKATNLTLKQIFALQALNGVRIRTDWFPHHIAESSIPTARPPFGENDIIIASAHTISHQFHSLPAQPQPETQSLSLNPSPFRPHCRADQQLYLWQGPNTPPSTTITHPVIEHLASLATRASLCDTRNYGAGLHKFHLFCNIFSIPETDRLPAAFELLHSFALWAVSDLSESSISSVLQVSTSIPYEPISVSVMRKYLAAVHAWHIAQGWPPPLSDNHHARINWSLRGLDNLVTSRCKPLYPPITFDMLHAIKVTLELSDPFDACIWAMASCAFFWMMRFSEVSVGSRAAFNPTKHLTRKDVFMGTDLSGKSYARLDLPSAKTACPGEIQSVFIVTEGSLCPVVTLHNLASVVPVLPNDPLFSWHNHTGEICPMIKQRALE